MNILTAIGLSNPTPVIELPEVENMISKPGGAAQIETITLGGGCFWCIEAVFSRLDGVKSAVSGFMGGHIDHPTYEKILSSDTGHIEVVQIQYDTNIIPTEHIIAWFWNAHDPTTQDRQGNDVGSQYASAIFYNTDIQGEIAHHSKKEAQKVLGKPVVTYIKRAKTFYPAEDYHQDYYSLNKDKNSYCKYVIRPKLKKLKLDNK